MSVCNGQIMEILTENVTLQSKIGTQEQLTENMHGVLRHTGLAVLILYRIISVKSFLHLTTL